MLGVSLDEQRSWGDPATAFKEWRNALYDAGVFVFKDAFREADYCGFSLYDTELPAFAEYYRNRLDQDGLAVVLGVKPARLPKLERFLYAG